ncbi:hypothetical protein evm_006775 [Chilo suppressalis]|nr:hypothetical protein evm_006775 [Chilo suppressalis]
MGLHHRRPTKKVALTCAHKAQRLSFLRSYLNFEYYQKHLTDKKSFQSSQHAFFFSLFLLLEHYIIPVFSKACCMMTYKSTQGNFRKPNKNNNEKYEQIKDTSQESQNNKKKYKSRKKTMKKTFAPQVETPSSSNVGVVRSQTHQEVARTTTAATTTVTASTSDARTVPLIPVRPRMIPVPAIRTYCTYGNPHVNYVCSQGWNRIMTEIHINNPSYNMAYYGMPVPVYNPTPVLTAPMYVPAGHMIPAPMVPLPYMPPMIPHMPPPVAYHIEELPSTSNDTSENEMIEFVDSSNDTSENTVITKKTAEQIVPALDVTSDSSVPTEANLSADALMYDTSTSTEETPPNPTDPLETYLLLSRKKFPPANMFSLDPNPMIDQLCSLVNLHSHVPWLLDLEFGLPKGPITRPIPIYNVGYSSIHCKNTPNAIHPGFESCSDSFKEILRLYYECIISVWYNAYMKLYQTRSVESFQEWLILGMQTFGMCWP